MDGKLKLGSLKNNKPYNLYVHPDGSPVAAISCSPNGKVIIAGHQDGSIWRFNFPDDTGSAPGQAQIARHPCVPHALGCGEAIVATGSDCRVGCEIFYGLTKSFPGMLVPQAYFCGSQKDILSFCAPCLVSEEPGWCTWDSCITLILGWRFLRFTLGQYLQLALVLTSSNLPSCEESTRRLNKWKPVDLLSALQGGFLRLQWPSSSRFLRRRWWQFSCSSFQSCRWLCCSWRPQQIHCLWISINIKEMGRSQQQKGMESCYVAPSSFSLKLYIPVKGLPLINGRSTDGTVLLMLKTCVPSNGMDY